MGALKTYNKWGRGVVEENAINFDSALGELLRHSNSMAFAHRNLQVFRYLIWQWQLRQGLNNADNAQFNAIDQAMHAVDQHLQSLLQESEPEFRRAIEDLLEIIREQSQPTTNSDPYGE